MFKNLVIICNTAKEEKKALEILEYAGNRWGSGLKATQSHNFKEVPCYGLVVCLDGNIVYSTTAEKYKTGDDSGILVKNHTVMTAKKFIKKYKKASGITIYRDGKKTIAVDNKTKKTGVAKCSPEDTYDFYTGAELALSRLIGKKPEQPQKEEFKPYLKFRTENYGIIGEDTPIKDAIGRELKVGDTVELYNMGNDYLGEKPIVKAYSEYIVMGIGSCCKKDGSIVLGFKIIKKRSHEDIKNGGYVDGVKYIKEEVQHG